MNYLFPKPGYAEIKTTSYKELGRNKKKTQLFKRALEHVQQLDCNVSHQWSVGNMNSQNVTEVALEHFD